MTDNSRSMTVLTALLTPDAADSAAAPMDQRSSRPDGLPSLDRRVEIYLRAMHAADAPVTDSQRQQARARIVAAMAADFADGLNTAAIAERAREADDALPVAIVAPRRSAVQWRPSPIAALASAPVQRALATILALHGYRLVPVLAMLLLVIVGSAIWLFYPQASFEVASKPPETKAAGTEAFVVQTLERSSEADAQAAFFALRIKFPAVLGDSMPLIRRIELGDASIIYRAELGPYGSFEQAREICGKLAETKETCMVRRR